MLKILDPQTTNEIPFDVGTLVNFVTKEAQEGYTELIIKDKNIVKTIKSGHTKMTPPTMVIKEIVLENHKGASLIDPRTGVRIGASIKANCQWFSAVNCKFFERWFSLGVLRQVPRKIDLPVEPIKGEIDEIVTLKTYLWAHNAEEHLLSSTWSSRNKKKKWKLKQVFDQLAFLPPKMVITGLAENTEKKPLYDNTKGIRIRQAAEDFVKCMWFDPTSGKYSEHIFPKECLIPGSLLPGQQQLLNGML